ncbi:MAG TPA: hypothetical protein VMV73_01625 [Candidatus Dormibacteraeota bacterium]|nr:hypothetical protein [Candidatus Dormibacteraeota bacterium]
MNAYTNAISYSVLTAPLAQIDRRALSQAWLSALHLPTTSIASLRNLPDGAGIRPEAHTHFASVPKAPAPTDACTPPSTRAIRTRAAFGPLSSSERRSPQSALARRIVAALLAPKSAARRCTLALGAARGRIHLLLGGSDAKLHLIALCAPAVREEVARALHEVRFALAARGILATSDLREFAA